MKDYQMGMIETKFADIIWNNEPIASSELVKVSERQFQWKKSTTYTVLKRLCEKGIFQNINGVVTSLISKEEFHSIQSNKFVNETFNGSLPAFLTAFTSNKKLNEEEISFLKKMIQDYKED